MAEPGDGVPSRDDARGAGREGGLDDAVLGGFEGVVEPAGEEIGDCARRVSSFVFLERGVLKGRIAGAGIWPVHVPLTIAHPGIGGASTHRPSLPLTCNPPASSLNSSVIVPKSVCGAALTRSLKLSTVVSG